MTLDEYFHKIVSKAEPTVTIGWEPSWVLTPYNQPPKEPSMFEYLKNKWTELTTTRYEFQSEPLNGEEDYWVFEMHTSAYECDGESIPMKHNIIMEKNDSTWHDTLDQILDVMGDHYGYNIKEQVYYSVHFPLTIEGVAGYSRMLNDEVLQKLLLAYPEVYDVKGHIE